jgi:hypothetical protein
MTFFGEVLDRFREDASAHPATSQYLVQLLRLTANEIEIGQIIVGGRWTIFGELLREFALHEAGM